MYLSAHYSLSALSEALSVNLAGHALMKERA